VRASSPSYFVYAETWEGFVSKKIIIVRKKTASRAVRAYSMATLATHRGWLLQGLTLEKGKDAKHKDYHIAAATKKKRG